MTGHELARMLLDGPDLPVYVRGYESGINDVSGVHPVTVVRDVHDQSYYGEHEIEAPDEDGDPYFYGQHRYPDEGASLPRTAGLHIWGGTE
jgi:hypothetical protein